MLLLLSFISCLPGLILIVLNNPSEVIAAPVSPTLDPKAYKAFESKGSWDWTRNPDGSYDFDKNVQYVMTKYGKIARTVSELCAKLKLADCQPLLDQMGADLSKSVHSLADTIRYFDQHVLETRKKAAEATAKAKASTAKQ